jgi:hypothetical protein
MIEVDKILEQAGYFETRKESVEEILKMYMANGYDSNSKQITFLEKYAFLEIRYTHPIWKQEMCLRMNPIEAQKIITMDVVEEYNEFLQDKLLIIGDIEKENMTIILSEKGTIYSGYDDCIIDWGTDFKTFLKHLINGEKGKLIIID